MAITDRANGPSVSDEIVDAIEKQLQGQDRLTELWAYFEDQRRNIEEIDLISVPANCSKCTWNRRIVNFWVTGKKASGGQKRSARQSTSGCNRIRRRTAKENQNLS
jgi:hypothetical protein